MRWVGVGGHQSQQLRRATTGETRPHVAEDAVENPLLEDHAAVWPLQPNVGRERGGGPCLGAFEHRKLHARRHAIDASTRRIGSQVVHAGAGDLGDLKLVVCRYADGPQILRDVVSLLKQRPDGFAAVGRFEPDVVEI